MNVQISGQPNWQAPEIERLMSEAEVKDAELDRLRAENNSLQRQLREHGIEPEQFICKSCGQTFRGQHDCPGSDL